MTARIYGPPARDCEDADQLYQDADDQTVSMKARGLKLSTLSLGRLWHLERYRDEAAHGRTGRERPAQ